MGPGIGRERKKRRGRWTADVHACPPGVVKLPYGETTTYAWVTRAAHMGSGGVGGAHDSEEGSLGLGMGGRRACDRRTTLTRRRTLVCFPHPRFHHPQSARSPPSCTIVASRLARIISLRTDFVLDFYFGHRCARLRVSIRACTPLGAQCS